MSDLFPPCKVFREEHKKKDSGSWNAPDHSSSCSLNEDSFVEDVIDISQFSLGGHHPGFVG